MRIEPVSTPEQVASAARLYDGAVRPEAVDRFLADPTHHLLLAVDGEQTVGFVSGVEMTHPDKGTEMFLYELAVDEAYQRRGVGTALVRALADRAVRAGCYGMWVGTEPDNDAAQATYRAAGASAPDPTATFVWTFSG
jgi:ribosomal protein S18 acetylase RimI-like enzyme